VGEPGTQGVLGGEVGEAVRLAAVARWRRILQLAVDYAAEEALYDPPTWGRKLRDALGDEYERLFDADGDLLPEKDVPDVYLALRRRAFEELADWPESLSVMRARERDALDRLRAGEKGILILGEAPPRVPKAARPVSERIREAREPVEPETPPGAEPERGPEPPGPAISPAAPGAGGGGGIGGGR